MDELHQPAFPFDEYRRRVANAQAAMSAAGLDALLVTNRADVCYLTGLENCYLTAFHAALLPASGEPIVLASDFEMLNASIGVWWEDRVTFPVAADPIEAICGTLDARGWSGKRRVGYQAGSLNVEQFTVLRRQCPDAELLAADGILHQIKQVKSAAEIAYVRKAARLTTLGMQAALAETAAGKSDNDLAAAAYQAMVGGGGEFMCIEPIVTVGRRSGVPHTSFRRTPIRPGDAVFIELGACVCRYTAPLMRTAAVAPVSDEVRDAAAACRDSLNAAIAQMCPGAVSREIAAKAKAAWMPLCQELIWHGIYAYSVGLGFPPDWNDAPLLITEESDAVLETGMCFHVTTSLRRAGQFGVALSETVLIAPDGAEVLTGTPRELTVVN